MDEFRADPHLHDTVKGIRESVRKLFEQLRLKHENGDITGKERLERVPALAKRNFANLTGTNSLLAAKEAWRLVDFLEGSDEARLSPRAREALRLVELEKKLAALRSSDRWKEAAARLREELGVEGADSKTALAPTPGQDPMQSEAGSSAPEAIQELAVEDVKAQPAALLGRVRPSRLTALIGLSALGAVAVAGATWRFEMSSDDPDACIALEDASEKLLAAHWLVHPGTPLPQPPRTEARERIFLISDPPNGGPVQSTWTTSQFSYAERTAPKKPGGGKSDIRLRVGGWGDTYLSLLQVPVPTDRLAHRAVVQLTVLGDAPASRPTAMTLRAIHDNWSVSPGPDNGMRWRDCPASDAVARHLPPPGPRGSVYEIDITDLYNRWASGFRAPYGIILEPEQIGSWGPGRSHYSNFSTFYSTRAHDLANRPRLILTY
ncbi:MAG: hypothetical protein QOJ94_1610 [Sphingomonadales bacterium]|nr:hypothetical protein [Sphingomonadales bacterium]